MATTEHESGGNVRFNARLNRWLTGFWVLGGESHPTRACGPTCPDACSVHPVPVARCRRCHRVAEKQSKGQRPKARAKTVPAKKKLTTAPLLDRWDFASHRSPPLTSRDHHKRRTPAPGDPRTEERRHHLVALKWHVHEHGPVCTVHTYMRSKAGLAPHAHPRKRTSNASDVVRLP